MKIVFFLFIQYLIFTNVVLSQNPIELIKENNIYKIQCKVNSIPMSFIFDTGASDVSISQSEANLLISQGLLKNEDIKETVKYKIANGSVEDGTKVILRKISIQGYILENIEASIVHHNGAPLLFGLNAINKIGKIEIENNRILIYPKLSLKKENSNLLNNDINLTEYDKIITKNPKSSAAYYNRATAHMVLGNYKDALNDLNKANEIADQLKENYEDQYPGKVKAHKLQPKRYNPRIPGDFERD